MVVDAALGADTEDDVLHQDGKQLNSDEGEQGTVEKRGNVFLRFWTALRADKQVDQDTNHRTYAVSVAERELVIFIL